MIIVSSCHLYLLWFLYNYFDKVVEGRINELKGETNDNSQPNDC